MTLSDDTGYSTLDTSEDDMPTTKTETIVVPKGKHYEHKPNETILHERMTQDGWEMTIRTVTPDGETVEKK